MRIVQWNTHHGGIGSDNKLNTVRLAKVLKGLNPDVITLNELQRLDGYGNQEPVTIICNVLGPEWTGHYVNISGVINGTGQGNAILSKTPFVNPIAKGLYKTRSAAGITIGRGIPIIATHLDNESSNAREVELGQIMCWVGQSNPIIIAGDWNAHEGNVELSSLYAYYKDAWHTPGATSFNGTGNTRGSRIDMVFYRGLTVTAVDVPDTRVDGIFPSDHHPVVVDFK